MSLRILIDTGPLVAAINRHEQWHSWCADQVRRALAPLWTCESVISEAWFILRATDRGHDTLMTLLARGAVQVVFDFRDNQTRVFELMCRYSNVPMSLADACLVCMSELVEDCSVLTLDNDFRVYRRHRRRSIPLLSPLDR